MSSGQLIKNRVENFQVSEVSRRGWNEASKVLNTGGSGGTLALTGGSGGPHERSSLLLGPGDGYQRLDNARSVWIIVITLHNVAATNEITCLHAWSVALLWCNMVRYISCFS